MQKRHLFLICSGTPAIRPRYVYLAGEKGPEAGEKPTPLEQKAEAPVDLNNEKDPANLNLEKKFLETFQGMRDKDGIKLKYTLNGAEYEYVFKPDNKGKITIAKTNLTEKIGPPPKQVITLTREVTYTRLYENEVMGMKVPNMQTVLDENVKVAEQKNTLARLATSKSPEDLIATAVAGIDANKDNKEYQQAFAKTLNDHPAWPNLLTYPQGLNQKQFIDQLTTGKVKGDDFQKFILENKTKFEEQAKIAEADKKKPEKMEAAKANVEKAVRGVFDKYAGHGREQLMKAKLNNLGNLVNAITNDIKEEEAKLGPDLKLFDLTQKYQLDAAIVHFSKNGIGTGNLGIWCKELYGQMKPPIENAEPKETPNALKIKTEFSTMLTSVREKYENTQTLAEKKITSFEDYVKNYKEDAIAAANSIDQNLIAKISQAEWNTLGNTLTYPAYMIVGFVMKKGKPMELTFNEAGIKKTWDKVQENLALHGKISGAKSLTELINSGITSDKANKEVQKAFGEKLKQNPAWVAAMIFPGIQDQNAFIDQIAKGEAKPDEFGKFLLDNRIKLTVGTQDAKEAELMPELIKKKEIAEQFMQTKITEIMKKYAEIKPEDFRKAYETPTALHNAVFAELKGVADKLPKIDTEIGPVSVNMWGIEMNNEPGVVWMNDQWSTYIYTEKYREDFQPAMTKIGDYVTQQGFPRLVAMMDKGEITDMAQFGTELNKIFTEIVSKTPLNPKPKADVSYTFNLNGVPYIVTLRADNKVSWKGDNNALATRLNIGRKNELAKKLNEKTDSTRAALDRCMDAVKKQFYANMYRYGLAQTGEIMTKIFRREMNAIIFQKLQAENVDLTQLNMPIDTKWDAINFQGRPFFVRIVADKPGAGIQVTRDFQKVFA